MGGATNHVTRRHNHYRGLSPRGRGNPTWSGIKAQAVGSIPAWAGQPARSKRPRRTGRVYPRVGGATLPIGVLFVLYQGLSPRGRGNRRGRQRWRMPGGSIPAWAGQPRRYVTHKTSSAVYPRVGGAPRNVQDEPPSA